VNKKDAKGKKGAKAAAPKKESAAAKKATAKKVAPKEPTPEPEAEEEEDAGEISLNVDGPDSESDEEDDQTAGLLAGFESSDDEEEEGVSGDKKPIDAKELAKATIPDEKVVKQKLEKLKGREKVCTRNFPNQPPMTTSKTIRMMSYKNFRLVFKTQ
jgi:nucleolar protein 15